MQVIDKNELWPELDFLPNGKIKNVGKRIIKIIDNTDKENRMYNKF